MYLGLAVVLKAKCYSAIIWVTSISARKNVFHLEMIVNMLSMDGNNQLQLGVPFTRQGLNANHFIMVHTTVDQVETMEFILLLK